MSSFPFFQRSLIAVALSAAFSLPTGAEGLPTQSGVVLDAAQTYFPPIGAIDTERSNSLGALRQIRADYAYARAISGQGVTIAVLDTGLNGRHREFSEPAKIGPGFNAINGSSDTTDRMGHGTHVAGLIGAGRNGSGMFGVAYDARIMPVKVLQDSGSGSTVYLDRGLRHAIGKAAIANISLGAASRYDPQAMLEAVRSGMLIVAAAGNDAAANPGWPARFAKEVWANNQIIAVGAVDANNRIAAFSNRAGDTAAWFLVAPGVRLMSPYLNDQYVTMSGTSMATPVVSGAAALIKQLWPTLRADQIGNILLVTATDLGTPGIDPIYGRGLLNVEKALQPIGTVTTTTFNGKTINVLQGAAQPSAAVSRLWSLAASGDLRVVGLDDFNRDFNINLGAQIARPATLSIDQVFGAMANRIETAEQVLADGAQLSVAYHRHAAYGRRSGHAPAVKLAAFSFLAKGADGREASVGVGGMSAGYFGVGALQLQSGMSFGGVAGLSNPYGELVPGASHMAVAQDIGGFKLKLGMLSAGMNKALATQDSVFVPDSGWGRPPKADAALFEISRSFGDAAMAVSFSQTSEVNAYLGSQSRGALAFGQRASTSSVQLAGALLLAPDIALAGQASFGVTPGSVTSGSLITEISGIRTNAFSLALIASDRVKKGDRFSVAVSQPLRTYDGRMVMDVMTGLEGDGRQQRERLVFSMVPAVREWRAEVNYQQPLRRDEAMAMTLLLRRNPNHMSEAPTEKLALIRYSRQF
ncbi:MAG TPA: S8 family peptidase [Noviherbaspirillum sp.]|jgi:hypothetical protein|uniref:S8 family peptidase n=1 Tax=Noviherbaspirillum sp. TaxID=1926288 RepID=UPI002DDD732B|nr:S8 family peptidase [Noviherbaspirillum sp.]HEV2610609.1 S8 family peptidase [Noviherbaspirillum sp.]